MTTNNQQQANKEVWDEKKMKQNSKTQWNQTQGYKQESHSPSHLGIIVSIWELLEALGTMRGDEGLGLRHYVGHCGLLCEELLLGFDLVPEWAKIQDEKVTLKA